MTQNEKNQTANIHKLEQLLSADPDNLVSSVQTETRALLNAKNHGLVFFGAGRLGEIALRDLRKAGRAPVAFADNKAERWGSDLHGIPIVSPQDAAARFGADRVFVITVYTSAPVWAQLRALGIEPISFARLAWLFPSEFLPHAGLDLPHRIFHCAAEVRAAFDVWSDEESRVEFLQQLQWRTTLHPEILRPHPPAEETYFANELFSLKSDEVFVDCGAFDGDSIRAFLNRAHGQFRQITGLEPDPLNRERLERFRSTLPADVQERIRLLPFAVGDKRERLMFDVTGTAASHTGAGSYEVTCAPLDEIAAVPPPTLIKMDIEGAEPFALRGASEILRNHRPILIICLYHALEHLWKIPLYLKRLIPEYDLFLRRYSDECWEIMCYALPRERWKQQ